MSVFLSLEYKQVCNGLEFSVLRSKASQLEDGREEEGRGRQKTGLFWRSYCSVTGLGLLGMVMAIGSSEAKVLACKEPLLLGFRYWLCLESQESAYLLLQRPLRFENQLFTRREGNKSSGGLTFSR